VISTLYYLTLVLAVWLIASPFALGYSVAASVAAPVVVGVVTGIVAVLGARKVEPRLGRVVSGAGLALAAWGVLALALSALDGGLDELLVGLALAALGVVVAAIRPGLALRAYDLHGNTLAEISAITMKRDDLVGKAVLLNSMPSTLYFRPEEVWRALGLLSWDVVKRLPRFLYLGCKRLTAETREGRSR
jgi:hypothetical protein